MLVEKIMPKRILSGVVISSNLDKTITVNVTRRIRHKLYKKIIRQTKKYHAHDENNECNVGDTVLVPKLGTLRIDFEGEEYFIAQDREILAVIREQKDKPEHNDI